MLLIAQLLHQTAAVCNIITASHQAQTAGVHLEAQLRNVWRATAAKQYNVEALSLCRVRTLISDSAGTAEAGGQELPSPCYSETLEHISTVFKQRWLSAFTLW